MDDDLEGASTNELLRRLLREQESQRHENEQLRAALDWQKRETEELRAQLAATAAQKLPSPSPTATPEPAAVETDTHVSASATPPLRPARVQQAEASKGAVAAVTISQVTAVENAKSKRGRNRSHVNPREIQSATNKSLKGGHRRTLSDSRPAEFEDALHQSTTAASSRSAAVGGLRRAASARRNRPASSIDPHEVNSAIRNNLRARSTRSSHRSRSDIGAGDVRAAFEEKRKSARPHPFLKSSDSSGRKKNAAFSNSPKTSRSVKAVVDAGGADSANLAASDHRGKSTVKSPLSSNPYPKRIHPVLQKGGSGGDDSPGRRRKHSAGASVVGQSSAGSARSRPQRVSDPNTAPLSAGAESPKRSPRKRLPKTPGSTGSTKGPKPAEPGVIRATLSERHLSPRHNDDAESGSRLEAGSPRISFDDAPHEAEWEGAYDEDEDEASANLIEQAATAEPVAEAAPEPTVASLSAESRAAKIARAKRLAKQRAAAADNGEREAASAADIVAAARAKREAAANAMKPGEAQSKMDSALKEAQLQTTQVLGDGPASETTVLDEREARARAQLERLREMKAQRAAARAD